MRHLLDFVIPWVWSRPRRLARHGCILLLGAVGALGPAHAVDASLLTQALDIERQVHALERAEGPAAQLHVLVGSRSPTLRLRRVVLRIDDREPQTYEYAAPEWEALAAGGLHPALTVALHPGAYRLRAELYARTLDAGPTDPRAVERLDRQINLAAGATRVELEFTHQRFGRSGLDVGVAADDATAPAAWQRAARFWLDADRPWDAARLIRRLPEAAVADRDELLATSLSRLSALGTSATNAAPIDAFNTAMASGDVAALTRIGTEDAISDAAWALRDHANLLLGYLHLRQGQGEPALEAFGRVRSPGPHGNAALLGFGWAFLVRPDTAGTLAPSPAFAGRPTFLRGLDRRVINAAADDDAREDRRKALQRALVPWAELIGRDPLDLDAQEGALAVAWALDELDTGAQSHVYYERAAHQLEMARARLDLAIQHVSQGTAADAVSKGQNDTRNGWRAWLADLPYADDTAYLRYLLADVGFVAAVDAYRVVRGLHDELQTCDARLDAVAADPTLRANLDAALDRAQREEHLARAVFEQRAIALLRERKQRTERYLVEARFAMARHFDSAPPPEVEIRRGSRS